MSETIRKVWNLVTTLILLAALVAAFLVVGVRFIGIQPYIVLSGSMEPAIHTGAMVYVKETDPAQLEVGDIITFRIAGDIPATHRIVEVTEEGFVTKGDANEHEDNGIVPHSSVIGSYLFSIPGLGYIVSFVQQPPGTYIGIGFAAALLLLMVLPEVIWSGEKKEDEN